jgi:hypothetical protein
MTVPQSVPSMLISSSSRIVIACGVNWTSNTLPLPQFPHFGIFEPSALATVVILDLEFVEEKSLPTASEVLYSSGVPPNS